MTTSTDRRRRCAGDASTTRQRLALAVIRPARASVAGTAVARCVIDGHTTISQDNRIYPFASLGAAPRDKSTAAGHRAAHWRPQHHRGSDLQHRHCAGQGLPPSATTTGSWPVHICDFVVGEATPPWLINRWPGMWRWGLGHHRCGLTGVASTLASVHRTPRVGFSSR